MLIDLIMVLTNSTRDARGQVLAGHREHGKLAWIITGAVFALGIVECERPRQGEDLPGHDGHVTQRHEGEQAITSFKTFRDSATFTTKRLIVRDAQGLTGKKVEIYSLPNNH